jgi:hypothetical protein
MSLRPVYDRLDLRGGNGFDEFVQVRGKVGGDVFAAVTASGQRALVSVITRISDHTYFHLE